MTTTTEKEQVTVLELEVMINTATNEFTDYSKYDEAINSPTWSFACTNERKDLAGAAGSAVKKGLMFSDEWDKNDSTLALTKKGVDYLKSIDAIPSLEK